MTARADWLADSLHAHGAEAGQATQLATLIVTQLQALTTAAIKG